MDGTVDAAPRVRAVRPRDMAQPQVAEEWDGVALHEVPHGTSMSPLYNGPMHAWQCERCKRVWHMRPGVEPPPTGCGNAFAGCAGREAPCARVPSLDYAAKGDNPFDNAADDYGRRRRAQA